MVAVLRVVAGLVMVAGVFAGFALGTDAGFVLIVSTIVTGILFLGFARVIELLEGIAYGVDHKETPPGR